MEHLSVLHHTHVTGKQQAKGHIAHQWHGQTSNAGKHNMLLARVLEATPARKTSVDRL
jgi:hypothetical protein